jgi:hypothetical protein
MHCSTPAVGRAAFSVLRVLDKSVALRHPEL